MGPCTRTLARITSIAVPPTSKKTAWSNGSPTLATPWRSSRSPLEPSLWPAQEFVAPSEQMSFLLVLHRALPDLQRMKLCYSAGVSSASRSVIPWCDQSPSISWTRGSWSTSDCRHGPSRPRSTLARFLIYGAPRRRRNPGGGDGTVASTVLRSRRSQRDGGGVPTLG